MDNPELNFFSNEIEENTFEDITHNKQKGGSYTKDNLDDIDLIKAYRKKNRELHKRIQELEEENKTLRKRLS